MIIKELIDVVDIKDVLYLIELHYGDSESLKFKELFNTLKNMSDYDNTQKFTLFINVLLEDENENILVNEFDEHDISLCYDVYASLNNDDTIYSIASVSNAEFLGLFIDEKTLEKMSYASILAHCFWEITTYDTRGRFQNTRGRFCCVDELSDICYNFVEVISCAKITKTKKQQRNISYNAPRNKPTSYI